jgi:hypothetical protein
MLEVTLISDMLAHYSPKLYSAAPAPADGRIERLGGRQRINRDGA